MVCYIAFDGRKHAGPPEKPVPALYKGAPSAGSDQYIVYAALLNARNILLNCIF